MLRLELGFDFLGLGSINYDINNINPNTKNSNPNSNRNLYRSGYISGILILYFYVFT